MAEGCSGSCGSCASGGDCGHRKVAECMALVKNKYFVLSGKGGVGKSSVAALLQQCRISKVMPFCRSASMICIKLAYCCRVKVSFSSSAVAKWVKMPVARKCGIAFKAKERR